LARIYTGGLRYSSVVVTAEGVLGSSPYA
jgi:hypothetical protein